LTITAGGLLVGFGGFVPGGLASLAYGLLSSLLAGGSSQTFFFS